MLRWISLAVFAAVIFLLVLTGLNRPQKAPLTEKRQWSDADLEALAPEEKITVAIWRMASYSVNKYLQFHKSWNLDDFTRSDFNLLKDVTNPYTGQPVQWGSDTPGDVALTTEGERLLLRVKWDREPPPQPVVYYHLERPNVLYVFAEPEVGWYLRSWEAVLPPADEPALREVEQWEQERLGQLQGADRRWFLLCTYLSGMIRDAIARKGAAFMERVKQDPTAVWWAVPPGLRNPYTGEPLRVQDQRVPGNLTLAFYELAGEYIVLCWDQQKKEVRGFNEVADRLVPSQ